MTRGDSDRTAVHEAAGPQGWGDPPQNVARVSAGEAHPRRRAAVVAGMPDAKHEDIDVRFGRPLRVEEVGV